MTTFNFANLLLITAFCCMIVDGSIDQRELTAIQSISAKSGLFKGYDHKVLFNMLLEEVNKDAEQFLGTYFMATGNTELTKQEKLDLIDFAIQTIYADGEVKDAEIKFFESIRHGLKIDREVVLNNYPDAKEWLTAEAITDTSFKAVKQQYFDVAELPTFDLID